MFFPSMKVVVDFSVFEPWYDYGGNDSATPCENGAEKALRVFGTGEQVLVWDALACAMAVQAGFTSEMEWFMQRYGLQWVRSPYGSLDGLTFRGVRVPAAVIPLSCRGLAVVESSVLTRGTHSFEGCRFEGSTVHLHGGRSVGFDGCVFERSAIEGFDGMNLHFYNCDFRTSSLWFYKDCTADFENCDLMGVRFCSYGSYEFDNCLRDEKDGRIPGWVVENGILVRDSNV